MGLRLNKGCVEKWRQVDPTFRVLSIERLGMKDPEKLIEITSK